MNPTSLITIALLSAGISAPIAYAASVRLRAHDEPALIDDGLTASVSAAVAGLGAGDVLVTLKATGTPAASCAADPPELTFVTHELIEAASIAGGSVAFTIRTDLPVAGVQGCPNEQIADIDFTDAFLEVRQPADARAPLLKAYCDRNGCTPIGS